MAQDLFDASGLDGLLEAGRRAEVCRRVGDSEGVGYWNTVRQELSGLLPSEDGPAPSLTKTSTWRLMQRIEYFRHRAAECLRKADDGSEAFRSEMRDAERHWLELATYAELLAERRHERSQAGR